MTKPAMELTLAEINSGMTLVNMLTGFQRGEHFSGGIDVHTATEGSDTLMKSPDWKPIRSGPFNGGRYLQTKYGYVTENPTTKSLSLVSADMVAALGIALS